MLDIDDVAAVSGVEPQILRNWIANGLITPTQPGGVGRGQGHKFSVAQATGICVAAALHRSERSCALSYLAKVVAAFEAVSEDELKKLRKGATHFIMPHQGRPVLGGNEYDRVDVQAAYRAVQARKGQAE